MPDTGARGGEGRGDRGGGWREGGGGRGERRRWVFYLSTGAEVSRSIPEDGLALLLVLRTVITRAGRRG